MRTLRPSGSAFVAAPPSSDASRSSSPRRPFQHRPRRPYEPRRDRRPVLGIQAEDEAPGPPDAARGARLGPLGHAPDPRRAAAEDQARHRRPLGPARTAERRVHHLRVAGKPALLFDPCFVRLSVPSYLLSCRLVLHHTRVADDDQAAARQPRPTPQPDLGGAADLLPVDQNAQGGAGALRAPGSGRARRVRGAADGAPRHR